MSTENKRDENGDRLLCDAWRGARTPEFRKFKRDFKASADAMFLHEDDYSVWQAMADTDQGGRDPNADPLPGQNQAGYANAVRSIVSLANRLIISSFVVSFEGGKMEAGRCLHAASATAGAMQPDLKATLFPL